MQCGRATQLKCWEAHAPGAPSSPSPGISMIQREIQFQEFIMNISQFQEFIMNISQAGQSAKFKTFAPTENLSCAYGNYI